MSVVLSEDELLEQFGVTDENGEVVVDRQALLRNIVARGVANLQAVDSLKADAKELVNEADEYGFDKTEVKALIKYAHKNSIDAEVAELLELQVKLGTLLNAE